MQLLFNNLPKHNSDHSPLARHAVVYTVEPAADGKSAAVVSALQVYKTTLDGGATELFAIGRYLDTVSLDGDAPKLAEAHRPAGRPVSSASAITFRSERRIPCASSSTPATAPTTSRRSRARACSTAGLAAGINLPYECGSGTCGTCKARLIEGEIDDRWPEAAGRKYLKQPGEFLMCQCVARSDCTVEVANFVYNMDPGRVHPRVPRRHDQATRRR